MLNKYVISELISLIDSEFKNFKTPEGVLNKEQFDYVTQLDLCLQKKISIFINNFFPGHFIIGEEGIPLTLDLTAPTWVIDPLDGTSNYLFGIPFIAVSIAYVSCGEVKSAFVYDLIHKDVYWANLGRGAFLNDSKLSSNDGRRSSDFIGLSSGFIDISVCISRID